MKKIFMWLFYTSLAITTVILSCKDDDNLITPPQSSQNQHPIADAGVDMAIVLPTDSVFLDGTASTDIDGSITCYEWSKIEGPSPFTIANPASSQTWVKNLIEGTYVFKLVVVDDKGLRAIDVVQVIVFPAASTSCDGSTRPIVNVAISEVGTLSEGRVPYLGMSQNKMVFAGGGVISGFNYVVSNAVDIYDVNGNSWSVAGLSNAREGLAVASSGTRIFFAGGGYWDGATNTIDILDVSNGALTVNSLSEARSYPTAATVGNKVVFAGGFTTGWIPSNVVDIYDLATGSWTIAHLSQPRFQMAAVTVGDNIYFGGGYDYANSSKVDIYNCTTNSWSTAELHELSGPVSAVAVGEKIYWAGIAKGQNKGAVEIWNTATGSVSSACLCYPRYAPAVAIRNNEIIFLSTSSDWNNEVDFQNNFRAQFDIYDLSTNQWSIGVLPHPVIAPGLACVNNNLYMGGGRTSRTGCTDKVYKLNW